MKITGKCVLLLAIALPLFAQQGFDFRLLDSVAASAKHNTSVNLDGAMLRLASNFLGGDKDGAALKTLISGLKGIYVRTYQFDSVGQYNEAALEPLRAFLRQQPWSMIVESREEGGTSEVYVQPLPNDRLGGVAIIAAEAKELTVVYIQGTMNLSDIGKLGGTMGIPELKSLQARPGKAKKDN